MLLLMGKFITDQILGMKWLNTLIGNLLGTLGLDVTMVFVWSALTKGDPAYTVVQVATNDLIILVAFVPIVKFLLGVSNVSVPWDTLILSVVLFVVIPLAGGMLTRYFVTRKKGAEYFESTFVKKFDGITTIGLLLTLVLIFAFQGQVILDNPLHIVLIAVPLILQTFLIFGIAYGACWLLKLPHRIAAPAGMIGASNFFELAVAVAVAILRYSCHAQSKPTNSSGDSFKSCLYRDSRSGLPSNAGAMALALSMTSQNLSFVIGMFSCQFCIFFTRAAAACGRGAAARGHHPRHRCSQTHPPVPFMTQGRRPPKRLSSNRPRL